MATVCIALRTGELPQQPVSQLPSLLLRHADDVRVHQPVRFTPPAFRRGHGRPDHILRLPRSRPPRL